MKSRATLTLTAMLVILFGTNSSAESPLRVGVAVVDITPPVPYRMSGYFSERLSTGIKDPLLAKAVVFEQQDTRAAIVFCDLIGLAPDVSREARRRCERSVNIPAKNISIVATHSHTGPLYFGALRKHFHDRAIRRVGHDPHEKVDYPSQLVERLSSAIQKAAQKLAPTSLSAGTVDQKRLSFNRRFHMKDGSVRFNPGQQNSDIVRVAGPIDPQVGMVTFRPQGNEQATAAIISYALHLDTVGGTEYSADYPYHLERRLRASLGDEFVSLFGAGTCGDINHVDVRVKGRRSAEEIGQMLGDTADSVIHDLPAIGEPTLAVRSSVVTVPLQNYSAEEIASANKDMQLVDSRSLGFLERVRAYKIRALELRGGSEMPLEVHAFRLSEDVAIVTLPGEVFVELGMAIKYASPFKTTLVIELANDAPGYIPTEKAFAEGSYETVNSRIASGGGERMVEAAKQLLEELRVR